jgi:hypothetical protein
MIQFKSIQNEIKINATVSSFIKKFLNLSYRQLYITQSKHKKSELMIISKLFSTLHEKLCL